MNKMLLNKGWTFRKINGNMENDRKSVCLPYDAMIRETRIPGLVGGETSAYYPGGIYEYERQFYLPETGAETSFLEFEGVWQKAKVLIDDVPIASHINGYTGFFVRLPERINRGEYHALKVIADNSQIPNSRWYTGSGIYRDVYLHTGNSISVLPDTVKIKTLSIEPAIIEVSWKLSAEAQGLMNISISRNSVPITEENAELGSGSTSITVPDPEYWSVDTPALYSISLTAVSPDGSVYDSAKETFGIRRIEWGGQNCLAINGREVKLRGACIHHDNGLIGSAEFRESAYRRIRILKECGYNAIRSAHNPVSTWILKACDEIGMYVMDEFSDVWRGSKNPYDYALYFDSEWEKDIESMVNHDFNHPSVIMYSTGNEVYDISHKESNTTQKKLADKIRSMDNSRPITCCINVLASSKQKANPVRAPKTKATDVVNPERIGKGA